jgi:hypothetical protein
MFDNCAGFTPAANRALGVSYTAQTYLEPAMIVLKKHMNLKYYALSSQWPDCDGSGKEYGNI